MATKNDVTLDQDRKIISWKGKVCRLTAAQFSVVSFLAQHPGFVRERGQIVMRQETAWADVQDDSVNSQIKRIRKNLQRDLGVDPIGTARGFGYYWKEDLA